METWNNKLRMMVYVIIYMIGKPMRPFASQIVTRNITKLSPDGQKRIQIISRKVATIPSSTKPFYKILKIHNSFHDKFIFLPNKNKRASWQFIFSSLNKDSFHRYFFLFTYNYDVQDVFSTDIAFPILN